MDNAAQPAARTATHYWPKQYHPLMGGGSTESELLSEIRRAESSGRVVQVTDYSFACWKVTVHIPA